MMYICTHTDLRMKYAGPFEPKTSHFASRWSHMWHTSQALAALTGGLQALDVPGGAQEEAPQVEEEEEEGQHRDQDPGDDRHRHGDHTQDLQEHLQGKQQLR